MWVLDEIWIFDRSRIGKSTKSVISWNVMGRNRNICWWIGWWHYFCTHLHCGILRTKDLYIFQDCWFSECLYLKEWARFRPLAIVRHNLGSFAPSEPEPGSSALSNKRGGINAVIEQSPHQNRCVLFHYKAPKTCTQAVIKLIAQLNGGGCWSSRCTYKISTWKHLLGLAWHNLYNPRPKQPIVTVFYGQPRPN